MQQHPAHAHLPSLEDCLALMEQYAMLPNIRHHSLVVARISAQIIEGLTEAAPHLLHPDRRLVITGALLHDIAKTLCLGNRCNHAQVGADICREYGYPELATIVAEHVLLGNFQPERYAAGQFSAAEIVYYADKRVRHHVVVDLEERLNYILEHYGLDDPVRHTLIRENFTKCQTLEQQLRKWLPFPLEDLGLL